LKGLLRILLGTCTLTEIEAPGGGLCNVAALPALDSAARGQKK
jgi:hypothetical protein